MPEINDRDPYTPPPMHHDRSGAVLRVALLAVMLGAAGLGYAWMQSQPQTALVPEIVEEQQMADAGYQVRPEVPVAAPDATNVAPEPTQAPQARRTAPAERAPAPTPQPEQAAPPPAPIPAPPTPIPPMDTPPTGTVGD